MSFFLKRKRFLFIYFDVTNSCKRVFYNLDNLYNYPKRGFSKNELQFFNGIGLFFLLNNIFIQFKLEMVVATIIIFST